MRPIKALVLEDYHRLVYKDVPPPVCGPDDLLVRVKACAICGSDVHGLDGSTGRRIPPVIMGHEAAGVVEAAGANVADLRPGDRLTFDSTIYCGACFFCRQGRVNLCENRRVLGVSCGEYRQDGAFAEYVAIPRRIAYRLPDALSFTNAAMVEPVAIALHAVNRANPRPGEAALVVGAGMIGLFLVQLLRQTGCAAVIAVDVDGCKLEMARELGATECVLANQESLPPGIAGIANGCGADTAFEAVGTAAALRIALAGLRKGGTLVLVGNLASSVDLPLQRAVTGEWTILGSCASAGEYPAALDLIAGGVVDVERLISASAPLSEGADWFGRLYRKEPGLMKVILEP